MSCGAFILYFHKTAQFVTKAHERDFATSFRLGINCMAGVGYNLMYES